MLLPKHDRPEHDLICSVAHLSGRLTPLAIDCAREKHDVTLYSVATGGMTWDQLNAVRLDWPTSGSTRGRSLSQWIGRLRDVVANRR